MRTAIFVILCSSICGCTPESKPPVSPAEAISPSPAPATESQKTVEFPLEEGFKRLQLSDFTAFKGEPDTWTEDHGILETKGTPKGYLYSHQKHENFTWRGDFQFELTEEQAKNPAKANTGFMLAIQEPTKVWPRSMEVQGRWDMMGAINPNGGVPAPATQDFPDVREKVRLGPTEWNTIEIVASQGKITSRLNGELVCTSEPAEVTGGLIGLQAEGYRVRFRNLRLRQD